MIWQKGVSYDDDESDKHLEARDRRYSCLTLQSRTIPNYSTLIDSDIQRTYVNDEIEVVTVVWGYYFHLEYVIKECLEGGLLSISKKRSGQLL